VARKCDPISLCMTRVGMCSVPVRLGLSSSVIRESLLSLHSPGGGCGAHWHLAIGGIRLAGCGIMGSGPARCICSTWQTWVPACRCVAIAMSVRKVSKPYRCLRANAAKG
jgi:hypothetical protein